MRKLFLFFVLTVLLAVPAYAIYRNYSIALPSDFSSFVTEETDPVFLASPAFGIGSVNVTYWNVAASNANIHYDVYPVTRTVWQHWSVP